jgi:hypothetical protein
MLGQGQGLGGSAAEAGDRDAQVTAREEDSRWDSGRVLERGVTEVRRSFQQAGELIVLEPIAERLERILGRRTLRDVY